MAVFRRRSPLGLRSKAGNIGIAGHGIRHRIGRIVNTPHDNWAVGVSVFKSHHNFITKQALNFVLLADEEHALAEALGVWVEKSMYGRTYMGIERSTFLVDAKGAIVREWRKVKVTGHVAEVLAAATTLT